MKNGPAVIIVLFASLLIVCISVPPALALWSSDPSANTLVATGSTYTPQITSDGSGGAIIVWQDYRNLSNAKVYAQRIDAQGDPVWTANGVEICTASGNQTNQQIVSDGSGGAVITWQDTRTAGTNHIYAQRIDAAGNVMWEPGGVAVCTAGANQYFPQIVSDYSGGAIITWVDTRTSTSGDIYAQRVDADGNPAWTTNGVAVCTYSSFQQSPVIATDGAGGAIIAWYDNRDSYYSIYAQRVYDDGTLAWTLYPNGRKLSSYTSTNQWYHSIAYDGMTGVIVAWRDGFDPNWNVYAQRIDINGNLIWSGGVAVSTAVKGDLTPPKVTDDGSYGAIITWEDKRNANDMVNIYAQRISAAGAAQWTANGVRINVLDTISAYYAYPQIVSDGSGGAVITWHGSAPDNDIYAQRINSAGAAQWTASGAPVATAAGAQSSPQMISNGSDGVIFTWQDGRTASGIYAQRVLPEGTLPVCSRITIGPSTIPGGTYNTAYNQTFSVSGCTGPCSLGLDGDLPEGMGYSGGTLSGTPVTTGSFPLVVTARDTNECVASKDYTLSIRADTTTTITSHTPDSSYGGQAVTINYTVTSSVGTPTGNVTVGDGTVSCTGTVEAGTCSLAFTTVGEKTLIAQYSSDANFNASTSPGVAHTVTPSSIRIEGTTPEYYATIQDVYNAVADGHIIQIQALDFTEILSLNRDVSITVQGGCNTEFNGYSGTTSISGTVTISNGTIYIAGIMIH